MNEKIKKIILFMLSAAMLFMPLPGKIKAEASVSSYKIGDNELRGVWIATVNNVNFPSKAGISTAEMKAELDDIIKTTKEAGLNAIFFQVRPTSDALYDSSLFPTSKFLSGTQGAPFADGFDPLAYIIEAAHMNNIELHAWINPYRITMNSHDLNALAQNNPARLNPSWVVKHPNGLMYYNPGLPEVRDLITQGVVEIINKYSVDGIHFDDYFYPSVSSGKFDDDAAYAKYGGGKNLDDWRRENVNQLVKKVYDEIKKVNKDIRFGISPSGIWANKSSNPAGSNTNGNEAYSAIFCDARAWVEGGYIDYICPQIYWHFAHKTAPYDILTRWWSTLLDGTGVDLYIGHAVYKLDSDPEFKSELEIPRQVEYARQYISTRGSIFYGYEALKANAYNVKDNLAKMFAEPRPAPKPVSNGGGVVIGRPVNNSIVTDASVNIMGGSNPAFPVYFNNQKMTRTKSGFFSIYTPLANGKNNLVFTQNNSSLTHVVTRGTTASSPDFRKMNSYIIEQISPINNVIAAPGDRVQVRVNAPSGSTVTAKLGGAAVTLEPLIKPPDEGKYMLDVYSGTITLPATQPTGALLDLGNITYEAVRGGESASLTGINVKLANYSIAFTACEVIKDYANIKTAPDSGWWEDYTFASVGMRDKIVGFENGYFKLSFGGYVSANDVILTPERTLQTNRIVSVGMEDKGNVTEIRFGVTENVPVDAKCKDGVFNITLYNTPDGGRWLNMPENQLFNKFSMSNNAANKSVTYKFDLIHTDNFYGFEIVYEGGFIIIKVKNPMKKIEGDKQLAGLTIVVDAGHGGSDPGSTGFLGVAGKREKDFNLDIALVLRDVLAEMGANVIMTRETDVRVDVAPDRTDLLNKIRPDLVLSVHHNSMADASDNARTRGYLGLYCDDSGKLLAKNVSRETAKELNRVERNTNYQTLAMLRNHRFPATLLEMSFMTNPDEYEFALSAEGVKRSAEGIAKGVVAWIDAQAQFVK